MERLKKQLRLNSTNSSKPSSTDGYFMRPQNSREKSGLKVGGQKGHRLHKSKLTSKHTHIIEKQVSKAPTGAVSVRDEQNNNILYYATQEIDMKISTTVIETRYYISESLPGTNPQEMKKYAINPFSYNQHII